MLLIATHMDGMRYNNFDTMRFAAAVAVVVSHSFPLSYGEGHAQPLEEISEAQTDLGTIAVVVFFILSGFLITASFRNRRPDIFLAARALRILPGLAVVLLALAFVIGPVLTALPIREYFGSITPYRYVAVNLSLTGYTDSLPGVFSTNPSPNVVNGSIWTLRYEAECYLLVFILGVSGLLNRYVLLALLTATLLYSWQWMGGDRVQFFSYFLGGAVFQAWRPPLRWWVALACALAWALSLQSGFRVASATAGAYLTLYIGLSPWLRLPNAARWGDLSYGTYIWAYPIQQIVTMLLGTWAVWYLNVLIALPVVLILALLSWYFVEKPALSLKSSPRLAAPAAERHFVPSAE